MSEGHSKNGEPAVIDMTDAAYWQDPHSILRAAREQHPIGVASTGEPIVNSLIVPSNCSLTAGHSELGM